MSFFIVSTPIGNLKDLSARALEILQNVDYILCEDTRRAKKLKVHFGLTPKLVSFHEHNEKQRTPKIVSLLKQGKKFALISDAGSPLMSDPGSYLIRELIAQQIPFTYIPGANAILAALVLSGLPTYPFSFHGFLPVSREGRKQKLLELNQLTGQTLVLFESPDRVVGLIREIGEYLGDREIAICRELTKLHEEVIRGRVSEVLSALSHRKIRGEFTVVIGPDKSAQQIVMSDDDVRSRYETLLKEGMNKKEALKKVSLESGRSRNDLYKLLRTQ